MAKTSYQRQKERIAGLNKEKSKIYTDLCKIAGIIDCSWTERQEIILHYRMDNDIYNAIWAGRFHDRGIINGGIFAMMQNPNNLFVYIDNTSVGKAFQGLFPGQSMAPLLFKDELPAMMQCLKPKHKPRTK
jgi:hypothetical protein